MSLRQKYKTRLCRHFIQTGECPLTQYCYFAHGNEELRMPSDPLPTNVAQKALGAIHSNYKTIPCKRMLFGDVGSSLVNLGDHQKK